jgi:hypothetical protein
MRHLFEVPVTQQVDSYQRMQTRTTLAGKRIPLKLSMANQQVFGLNSLPDLADVLVNATEPFWPTAHYRSPQQYARIASLLRRSDKQLDEQR